jgi:hypothetical protein
MIGSQKRAIHIIPDYTLWYDDQAVLVLDAKKPSAALVKSEHVEQVFSYAIHPDVRPRVMPSATAESSCSVTLTASGGVPGNFRGARAHAGLGRGGRPLGRRRRARLTLVYSDLNTDVALACAREHAG